MDKEEIKIKEFDKEQLELLLKDLQDIDKFTGFKDGAFKYELGKYQANLLVNCIKKQKEVIDKAVEYVKNEIPYLQETDKEYEDINGHTYFTYKEYDGKELLDILKEVSE